MKYKSRKTVCAQGHCHDSVKEANRCNELNFLEKSGKISGLEIQKKFLLIPSHRYENMPGERSCSYIADFCYSENDLTIIEDTKGFRTKDYIIKRKLLKEKYCLDGKTVFREV